MSSVIVRRTKTNGCKTNLPAADKIFATLAKANPEPKTELEYTNNYTLLVAVVLSAQATDKGVNKATRALFEKISTPEEMLALGENGLKKYIKTIGLFNAKAKNIIGLSHMLVEKFNSQIPEDLDDLQTLPGVGRKTANVLLNCAFGKPTIAVDTHVQRVANRIGLASSPNPLKTEQQLLKSVPEKWRQHAHHWLILHGRYICKARTPECSKCAIKQWCKWPEKKART